MPAPVPRWLVPFFWLAVAFGAVAAIGVPVWLLALANSPERAPYRAAPGEPVDQPMWFSHRHHVTAYNIDCLYCHYAATRSSTAGIPATETCVPCHDDVWLESPYFEPVRRSLETGRPIPWNRVYDLPDYVYFDHAIHVNNGVGCETCHGRVDRMAEVYRAVPMTMQWCLECHREPARHLRPLDGITTMGWEPERPRLELGRELARRYDIRRTERLVTCTACHR